MRLCDGKPPRTRATFSECPHGLFFLPESKLNERLKSLESQYPPFTSAPADPPKDALEIESYLEEPYRPLPNGWAKRQDVAEVYRKAMRGFAASIPSEPPPYPAERGIVIAAGGIYALSALISLRMIRQTGCDLPAEFWAMNADEIRPWFVAEAKKLGAVVVNAEDVRRIHPPRITTGRDAGWTLKAYAIAYSSFAEVLYLDADSYPVRDPSPLFESDAYREHGAIFWPDCLESGGTDLPVSVWETIGIKPHSEPEFESGQMLVNKRRCHSEILLAVWINQHAEFYYHFDRRHAYGDKFTFHVAWRFFDRDFGMPSKRPDLISPAMLQYGLDGQPMFVHRVVGKFFETEHTSGYRIFHTTLQKPSFNPLLPGETTAHDFASEYRRIAANDPIKPCTKCNSNKQRFDGAKDWNRLHTWATMANLTTARAWIDEFIRSLECDECRTEAYRYVADHPPDLTSNLALAKWTYDFHDATSGRINRPRFTFDQVAPRYGWDKLAA